MERKRNFIGIRQLITISATQQFRRFPRSAIPFVIDCKELKTAQIYHARTATCEKWSLLNSIRLS